MFTIKEIVKRESKVSKQNKPYIQFVFKTTDGRQISGFGDEINAAWKAGDTIQDSTAVIEQNGQWWNLKMLIKPEKKKPDMSGTTSEVVASLNELHGKIDVLSIQITKILNTMEGNDGLPI